ncbi:hypothetical protein GXW83_26905 [Streptacidiphilus sp. PB12-B1b]|uniref:hypothetical protein n=1 Tax=Streptacidiphilus sp. PB12-B1b TaxID=2705012 RepID=UPI0015F78DFF|nr:hypothetical protein [Streptacidiphilus sp. PB12-B1b]QMU78792.1 hypothetical protein GXW83_26905 [Streptacidiphilus sp. PB12-B1b]
MSADRYPGIGFDPAPGDPDAVAALRGQLAAAAGRLGDARALVERIAAEDGPQWQGAAAAAFRAHLGGGLAGRLAEAHDSLRHAADQLDVWHADLLGHQSHARRLDAELLDARAAARTAAARSAEAVAAEAAAPCLPHPRPGPAAAALLAAADAATRAEDEIQRLQGEARELEQAHAAEAARIAERLRGDWAGTAPQPPDLLDRLLDGLCGGAADAGAVLYDHIGAISAASGFLALFPSPLTPLLAGIAIATGTVQLDKDVHDPRLWAELWPPRPGLATARAAAALGGDVAGVVPGVGALARAGSGTVKALRAATAAGRVVPVETAAGSFLRNTVTVLSREARGEAAVRPLPGMTADDLAARRRRILLGRAMAGGGLASALHDDAARHDAARHETARHDDPGEGER